MGRQRTLMFNSPFDSFHNTVAEAKDEREQLDRLLTISTPRERLLVVGIALLLCILLAWLFFGSVTRSLAVDGVLVEPGMELPKGNRSAQALVWIEGDAAGEIEAGVPVVLELNLAGGESGTLDGVIETISPAPVSEELVAVASAAPVTVHRVDIALDESLDLASLADGKCRIVILLGNQAPVAFFD